MTLTITIVSRVGIWQSSDHRLSTASGPLPDPSMKHAYLDCLDGKALIAYAGIGAVRGIHVSDWVGRVLRGRPSLSLKDSMYLLADCSTRRISPISTRMGAPRTFSVGAYENNEPIIYFVTNRAIKRDGTPYAKKNFAVYRQTVAPQDGRIISLEGSGASTLPRSLLELALGETFDRHRASGGLHKRVIQNLEYLSRRAARSDPKVSPQCVISQLLPDGTSNFAWGGQSLFPASTCIPAVMGGHDVKQLIDILLPLTEGSLAAMLEAIKTGQQPPLPPDIREINEKLASAPWEADDSL